MSKAKTESPWLPLAKKLRVHEKLRMKNGVEDGHRIMYFKGSRLINVLVSDPSLCALSPKPLGTRVEASKVADQLLREGFFHSGALVERHTFTQELVPPMGLQFHEDALLVWDLPEPNSWKTTAAGFGVVIGALLACMFPLWPVEIRMFVANTGLGIVGIFFALIPIRYVIYGVARICTGKEVWLFPNMLQETKTVMDAFRPVWTVSIPGSASTTKESKKDAKQDSKQSDAKETAQDADSSQTKQD